MCYLQLITDKPKLPMNHGAHLSASLWLYKIYCVYAVVYGCHHLQAQSSSNSWCNVYSVIPSQLIIDIIHMR